MQTPLVNSAPLTPGELAAWRGMLRAHSALVHDLDAELRDAHDLSLLEYEVLLVLSETPEGRMRMTELAGTVLLSQSGLTRLVDRLVLAGAVERTRCETDRRGLNAELTSRVSPLWLRTTAAARSDIRKRPSGAPSRMRSTSYSRNDSSWAARSSASRPLTRSAWARSMPRHAASSTGLRRLLLTGDVCICNYTT